MAAIQNIEMKSKKGKWFYRAIMTILIIGIPIQLFPFILSVTNCLKSVPEIESAIPSLLPANPNWHGFIETFTEYDLRRNFINSFTICGMILVLQLTVSALAAYSLSILKPKYGRLVLLLFVGTMMISAQAILFPLYLMIVRWGLLDSFWSLILPSTAWGYSIFLFKGFFDGLPSELMEAARIDGAGYLKVFMKIVLPLSKPVIVVNLINTFVIVYNDIVMPYLFLPSEKNWTVMVRIFVAMQGNFTTKNILFIMAITATIPLLILYTVCQKQIEQGITMTGLKG